MDRAYWLSEIDTHLQVMQEKTNGANVHTMTNFTNALLLYRELVVKGHFLPGSEERLQFVLESTDNYLNRYRKNHRF